MSDQDMRGGPANRPRSNHTTAEEGKATLGSLSAPVAAGLRSWEGARLMVSDALHPPITDGSGYTVRRRDIEFLNITSGNLKGWRGRSTPLGMSQVQYRGLVKGLA